MKKALIKLGLGVFALAFFACQKQESVDTTQSANDFAVAEYAFDDIFRQVDNGYDKQETGIANPLLNCVTISITPGGTAWPKTLTLDFGTGCTDIRGVVHAGILNAVYSAPPKQTGASITITPDNYTLNGNKIEGKKIITNNGRNAANNLTFSVEVKDGKVHTVDGIIQWNSNRQNEWIAGEATAWPNYSDDVYLVTGTGNGINVKNEKFSMKITKALKVELNCRWITEGILEMDLGAKYPLELDYGQSGCDNNATFIYNKKSYSFFLK